MLVLAASSTATAGPGTGYRAKAARLRVQAERLDSRIHRTLLDLYALDARLARARRQLASLQAFALRLQARQAALTRELAAAQRTLVVSERRLGDHLRTLYEQGDVDPLAVVLGATSLAEALSRLDGLSRAADQSRKIVAAAATARARLEQLRVAVVAQRRKVDASLGAARRGAAELESTRAARLSFVSSLRTRRRLNEEQVRDLLAIAARVERKSAQIQAQTSAASAPAAAPLPATAAVDPPTSPQPAPAPAAGRGERTLRVTATGYSLSGRTSTGMPVGWGVVAVDPSVIPLGTKLTIPGYGEGVAADVGGGVRGSTIDLWFPTAAQARAWGRRTVTVTLH